MKEIKIMEQIKCPHCGEYFTIDESGYTAIVNQIRDNEFERRINQNKKELEENQKTVIDNAVLKASSRSEKKISELELHIRELESQHEIALSKKDAQIDSLKQEASRSLEDSKRAVDDAVRREKDKIKELENEIKNKELSFSLEMNKKDELFKEELRHKDEEIARVKEFKLQQSTKMVGESLERFCENEFNKLRATGFQSAYFEKDNDARSGSKGDFIFRDYSDGVEYISIMFEMKNENDETKTKHRNEDFFKELDKDRKEKGCEYAVLVTMLESDNEYYNTGIVDVSYKYPKMYVVRPQFFIPVITLLRNAAMNNLEDKKALMEMQSKNVDVSTFEASLLDFKEKFGKNYDLANRKFKAAIEEIDKTIQHLQKVKDDLISSENNLRFANDKLEDLTIKKLTKKNPTMKQMFEEAGADVDGKMDK
jgi:hypothetical protein